MSLRPDTRTTEPLPTSSVCPHTARPALTTHDLRTQVARANQCSHISTCAEGRPTPPTPARLHLSRTTCFCHHIGPPGNVEARECGRARPLAAGSPPTKVGRVRRCTRPTF
eukprot:2554468-Prymnesium_polylepis.2